MVLTGRRLFGRRPADTDWRQGLPEGWISVDVTHAPGMPLYMMEPLPVCSCRPAKLRTCAYSSRPYLNTRGTGAESVADGLIVRHHRFSGREFLSGSNFKPAKDGPGAPSHSGIGHVTFLIFQK